MDKKQLRNTLLLICAAFIWGTAFVAQSVGSGYMGAYTFLASRSWLACVFLLGMLFVRRAGQKKRGSGLPFWIHGKTLVLGGICCGTALFAASAAQQMGIGTTSTAKAGFMTALYVVLVPVAGVFLGSRPGIKLWCCVAVSVVGLYLALPCGARYAQPDRRRVAAAALRAAVHTADPRGKPLQPQAGRHPAQLRPIFDGRSAVHDLYVCL